PLLGLQRGDAVLDPLVVDPADGGGVSRGGVPDGHAASRWVLGETIDALNDSKPISRRSSRPRRLLPEPGFRRQTFSGLGRPTSPPGCRSACRARGRGGWHSPYATCRCHMTKMILSHFAPSARRACR